MKLDKKSDKITEQMYGQIFKKFRESKKFSRSEAAVGVMTTTGLLNFENGSSIPAFDKIFKMLKNINVTLLEYENACNHFSQELDIVLYDASISEAYLTQDVEKLKSMLVEIKNEIALFKEQKRYRIAKWHIEALIKKLDSSYLMPVHDIFYLKDYLIKLDDWGIYDIHLFGHCVDIFCVEDFKDLIEKMLNLTSDTANLPSIKHAMIQTTLNVIDSCLSRKEFGYAQAFTNHLKHLKIHEYYMYEKFTLKYSEASRQYQTGKKSSLEIMKKCQEIAFFCDCPATAGIIAQEIAILESKNKENEEEKQSKS